MPDRTPSPTESGGSKQERVRRFREARDAVEFSLSGAFASVGDARDALYRVASTVEERAEVDGLRGAIALVAYAVEGLAVAVGQIELDGGRRR